ncbi:MAG TPA: TCR/Tet family MFS transporter [Xanthobacteraceae bacterium]|jgi:DHA1 family tetracycline resistance protein-like MFS transporter|nr:TCR/Tet family MFS transporter [Xanthobacteraceae bacterium]
METVEQPDATPATSRRQAAFVFIFVTILLDMLSLGVIIPVLPKLVVDFMGGDTAVGAEVFGLFATAWALMQFLISPLQGALSDRFGRRALILISNFGVGIDYIIMALAPDIWWLFAGRVVSGVMAASIPTAYAYVADVTPQEQRAARFGLLGAAFGAGFVLGPALGGMAGAISPRLPFWIAAGLSLANAAYGLFILPESLPAERRVKFDWARANPLGALELLRSHHELLGLAGSNFLANLAHASLPSIGVLYMSYRYDWHERAVGLTLAGVGVASIIVQSLVIGPVTERIGERGALFVGLAFGALGFFVFAMAQTGVEFWLGIPLMALWGLASPASLALMSRRVSASEQGILQGANSSITGVANLIGPTIFTLTFAFAIRAGSHWELPGTPFLIATALLVFAGLTAWRATRNKVREPASRRITRAR